VSQAKAGLSLPPARSYEVFGRHRRDGCLHHLGVVLAPNEDLAKVQAATTYDEHPWEELCIAASEAFVAVLGRHGDRSIGVV